jgi:hypothetical protein
MYRVAGLGWQKGALPAYLRPGSWRVRRNIESTRTCRGSTRYRIDCRRGIHSRGPRTGRPCCGTDMRIPSAVRRRSAKLCVRTDSSRFRYANPANPTECASRHCVNPRRARRTAQPTRCPIRAASQAVGKFWYLCRCCNFAQGRGCAKVQPQEAIRTSATLARIALGCVLPSLDSVIWRGRRGLISAPEEVRVLMASVAEHVMDGSDSVCDETAGSIAARRLARP